MVVNSTSPLVVVANRLPFVITKDAQGNFARKHRWVQLYRKSAKNWSKFIGKLEKIWSKFTGTNMSPNL